MELKNAGAGPTAPSMALARRASLALLAVAAPILALPGPAASAASPACQDTGAPQQRALMRAYRTSAPIPVRQIQRPGGGVGAVLAELPPIAFDGPGSSPDLPTGPCQTIYRFAFPEVDLPRGARPGPFRYAEIDWNTEGIPRGPNGAFVSPHFDLHLYRRPRHWVDHHVMCRSSDGRTCDPQRTPYRQMQRFLELPGRAFVPRGYSPDVGSSIPMMGLHLLDDRATYTVRAVDHHPTLIYGSFAGEVLFAEASVTLQTLQDAVAAADHEVRFRYRRPRRVEGDVPWPTRFVVRHRPATGTFVTGFTRFRRAAATSEPERAQPAVRPPDWPPFTEVTRYVGQNTLGNAIELYPVVQAGPNVQIVGLTQPAHGTASDPDETSFMYSPPIGYCNDESTPDDVVVQLTDGIETGPVTVHVVVPCASR